MIKNCKKYLPLIIGILIVFPGLILPSMQATINNNEQDHDECDHVDHLQLSYPPCECGNLGCTGNLFTCPWGLGVPYPAPTLTPPPSPDEDGIITLTWTSSYGANSYKVYRSDAEFGTYTLITTTSILAYTDTTTEGTWWYYVKAHNNNGDSAAGNKVTVEVALSSTIIWYESNEAYNIGDFPANEWTPDGPGSVDRIDVVWASHNNVDMWGKAIRVYSPEYGSGTDMIRFETLTLETNESLYLKFKAQINKIAADGEGKIYLIGESAQTFLGLTFDTYWETIDFEFADGQIGSYDLILNQAYDFDIMFIKDPNTNNLKYLIFIDQKLEFVYEVNTALYPIASYIELSMIDEGPGEFFIDNFFLGRVDNNIYPEETIELAFPMYYVFAPDFNTPYLDSIDMKYRYVEITTESMTTSLLMGFSAAYHASLSVSGSIPLSQVIDLSSSQYEVSTNGMDLIVFNLMNANKSDITFDLPGVDPETDASNITGWYTFDILDQSITGYTKDHFESDFGLPDDFDYCKNEVSKVGSLLFKATGGPMTDWLELDQRQLEISYSYTIGVVLGIPLYKYVNFNLGLLFKFSYSYYLETELSVGVRWGEDTPNGTIVQTDLYAPPQGSYSTPLDLPPYSAGEVTLHFLRL